MIVRDYVKGFKNADELLDMISAAMEDQEAKATRGEMLYPDVSFSPPGALGRVEQY